MQLAQVNQPIGIQVVGLEPGLVGQITVEVYDPVDGRTILPATSGGISEPRSGSYHTTLVVTVPGSFNVRWLPPAGVAVESEIKVTTAPITAPITPRSAPVTGSVITRTAIVSGIDVTATAAATATAVVPVELRPTIEEVSNLLYDRIVKQGGHMGDVFDDETTPTGTQVEGTITMAVNQLVSRVDVVIKEDQVGQGRWLATLYASAMTALVFVPEQNSESPVYTGLMTEYGAQINDWIRANRYPLTPYIG